MKKLIPILLFSLLITASVILNSCGESNSLDDVPLSKQTYSQWKEYMDNGFKTWYEEGKGMSNMDLKQMYVSSAWAKEDEYEKNIDEFASIPESQKEDLKHYANNTCKQYVDKIGEAWNIK